MGNAIYKSKGFLPDPTAWYSKSQLTFEDLLNAVRRELKTINSPFISEFIYPQDGIDSPLDEGVVMGFYVYKVQVYPSFEFTWV